MDSQHNLKHPYALPIGWLALVAIWTLIGLWGLASVDAASLAYLIFWLHCAALVAPSLSRLIQLTKHAKKTDHHEAT